MTTQTSALQLSEAVFQHVDRGAYPEDEQIVSSNLPASALRDLSELVERARSEVKASIRELSRLAAPDVDDWILEAKQLQKDVDDAGTHAEQISQFAQEGDRLRAERKDAEAKVELLRVEVAFDNELCETLDRINELRGTTDRAQDAVSEEDFLEAVQLLREGERRLTDLEGCQNTRMADLVRARLADLHKVLEDSLTALWDGMIHFGESSVTVKAAEGDFSTKLETVVEALDQLDLLPSKILLLRKAFDQAMASRFALPHTAKEISISGNTLLASERLSDQSSERLFADVGLIIRFISDHLPASVAGPLNQVLVPNLLSRMISGPLTDSIPADLESIPNFQQTLAQALAFAASLHEQGINRCAELERWASAGPSIWLKRRSESALHSVRQLLIRGLGNARTVERVEKQMVTRQDDVFATKDQSDDWDASWSDGEAQQADSASKPNAGADDEGEGAWGLAESEGQEATAPATAAEPDDTEAEAWGWGDDDPDSPRAVRSPKNIERKQAERPNGHTATKPPTEREVTLRENYTITALPEGILEMIISVVEDADRLVGAEYVFLSLWLKANLISSFSGMASASAGLYALPGVILTMFRASAPNVYASHPSGNMYLYNDSSYLAEQLRSFVAHHSRHAVAALDLEADVAALALFGRRIYSQEMEAQRTILRDLIDGAQGFVRCTESPFAQQCDLAIASSIDRLHAMHAQWQGVLSRSALLQALGSLLATLAARVLLDVADLGDISEAESQSLTRWCTHIEALEDLFLPEPTAGPTPATTADPPIPLTAVYTPGWLKFRYLTNILESSLADIRYLWTEGELAMEFAPDEVVDLIEALFADSEHRRKAVAEIQRTSRIR